MLLGSGEHFSTQHPAKLSSGKEGAPQVLSSFTFPLPFPKSLGCTKALPLGEQAGCLGDAHPCSFSTWGGLTPWPAGSWGIRPFTGQPAGSGETQDPKNMTPPLLKQQGLGRGEGSKQLLLPNMGLTASDEATAEACRHPAGRFKGTGSSKWHGRDLAGSKHAMGQGTGSGQGCVSLVGLAAPAGTPGIPMGLGPAAQHPPQRPVWGGVSRDTAGSCRGDLPVPRHCHRERVLGRPHPKARLGRETPFPLASPRLGRAGNTGERFAQFPPQSPQFEGATAKLLPPGPQGPPRRGCWTGPEAKVSGRGLRRLF